MEQLPSMFGGKGQEGRTTSKESGGQSCDHVCWLQPNLNLGGEGGTGGGGG